MPILVDKCHARGSVAATSRFWEIAVSSTNATAPQPIFFTQSRQPQDPIVPDRPIVIDPAWPILRRKLAGTYNRLGGLIGSLAGQLNVGLDGVLAVWQVESGGATHSPGHAIIRFENHLLFRAWGHTQSEIYRQHFKHGGFDGTP